MSDADVKWLSAATTTGPITRAAYTAALVAAMTEQPAARLFYPPCLARQTIRDTHRG